MQKGMSPVVAVVLLIAIAVVASAGVWFWVAPMMTSTQTSDVVGKYQLTITNCRVSGNTVTVSVRNIGTASTPASATAVPVYNSTSNAVSTADVSGMASGEYDPEVSFTVTSSKSGTFYIEDSNFAKTTFSC